MYYCTMPVSDLGGGAGGTCPHPPRRGRGECPKKTFRTFICTLMFWWCLGWFGVFRGRRFPKKKFSALYVRRWFGGVWGVLGRFGVFRGRRFPNKI